MNAGIATGSCLVNNFMELQTVYMLYSELHLYV